MAFVALRALKSAKAKTNGSKAGWLRKSPYRCVPEVAGPGKMTHAGHELCSPTEHRGTATWDAWLHQESSSFITVYDLEAAVDGFNGPWSREASHAEVQVSCRGIFP
jgi:hypothetical protein